MKVQCGIIPLLIFCSSLEVVDLSAVLSDIVYRVVNVVIVKGSFVSMIQLDAWDKLRMCREGWREREEKMLSVMKRKV